MNPLSDVFSYDSIIHCCCCSSYVSSYESIIHCSSNDDDNDHDDDGGGGGGFWFSFCSTSWLILGKKREGYFRPKDDFKTKLNF
ncbi:uncharacterized protein DS421_12g375400 [Arachis hypogaea]|nr:uncharacterized protein DS421_12g375400 [Arachis hypogaea]